MSSLQKLYCLFLCLSLFLTTLARETRGINLAYPQKLKRAIVSEVPDARPSNSIKQPDPNRTSDTNTFSFAFKKESEKHKAHRAFISNMFKLFDLDGSREINKREFRLVFQLLRIVDTNLR